MRSRTVPSSWKLSSKLRQWTHTKGLTDKMIEDELERFRVYEWDRPKQDFNRCWQTRILNGLKRGWITLPKKRTHRGLEVISDEQKRQDQIDFDRDMKKFGMVK